MFVLHQADIYEFQEKLHKEGIINLSTFAPLVMQRPKRGVDKCHSLGKEQFQEHGIKSDRTPQTREMNNRRPTRSSNMLGGSHAHKGRMQVKALLYKTREEDLL